MIRSRVSLSQEIVLISEMYVAKLRRLTAAGDTSGAAGSGADSTRVGGQAGRMTG